jgi:hypothetical protein
MRWQTPMFFEVKMDAEIGSYQQDDERDEAPFTAPACEATDDENAAK